MRRLLFVVCMLLAACNGLRSGPIDNTPGTSPLDDGGSQEGGGGSSSGNSSSDGGLDPDGSSSSNIDADIDPEWAMSVLPAPLPPAGNYSVADGVVKDEVTGLTWMQNALTGDAHAGAERACATSSLNGGGWRLPTRTELLSIAHYTSKGFNQDVFGNALIDGVFWASSLDSVSSTFRWTVRFGVAAAITDDQSATRNVRCVRGPMLLSKETAKPGAPRGHYIYRSPVVAYDVRTRLEWMRQPAKATVTGIEDALNTCASSTLEGTQWRLPTARELETLFDVRAIAAPAWDTATFGSSPVSTIIFWTLTELPNLPSPYTHLGVDFRPSMSTTTLKADTSQAFVRCVRGPK